MPGFVDEGSAPLRHGQGRTIDPMPAIDAQLINHLTAELVASTAKARVALDRTIACLADAERDLPAIEAAARERATAEFASLDPALIARLVQEGSTR